MAMVGCGGRPIPRRISRLRRAGCGLEPTRTTDGDPPDSATAWQLNGREPLARLVPGAGGASPGVARSHAREGDVSWPRFRA